MEQQKITSEKRWDTESVRKMISLALMSEIYEGEVNSTPQASTPLDELLNHGILRPSEQIGIIGHIDRWNILKVIEIGGMGIVLLAEDNVTSVKKAIKLLRPHFLSNPTILGHFLEEIHVLTKLSHPNIVPFENEEEEVGGAAFMVMPYYPLGSLENFLKIHPIISNEGVLKLILGIAKGLSYAHGKGIIHFDLKPGNILLESPNYPRISDFGLARCLASDTSLLDAPPPQRGTLPYMSPGILAGQAEFMLSDIYALGAVLYELLTGQAPYKDYKGKDLREHILSAAPTPILKSHPSADPSLSHLSDYMMHREPTKRPPSMAHIIEQLELIQRGNSPYSAKKFSAKERRVRTLNGRTMTMLLTFAIVSLILFILSKHQKETVPGKILSKNALVNQFDSIHVGRWDRVHFSQWDGLVGLELVLAEEQNVMIFNRNGILLNRWSLNEPNLDWSRPARPIDVYGDYREEIGLEWGNTNLTELIYFDQNPRAVGRYSVIPSPHNDKNINFTTTLSLQLAISSTESITDRPLVIAQSGTYFSDVTASPWKRGIHAFDKETGKQIWEIHVGPPSNGIHALHLDGDGKLDFVTGSSSVGNGNIGQDGSIDELPYIFAVNAYGKLMWNYQIGVKGEAWTILGTSADQNNKPLIYVGLATGEFAIKEDSPEHFRIAILNSEGNIIKSFSTQLQLQQIKLFQSAASDNNLVILSDQVGGVHMLSETQPWTNPPLMSAQLSHLSKLKSSPIDKVYCGILEQGAYTHEGATEFAFLTYETYNSGDLNSNDATLAPHVKEYINPTIHILDTKFKVVTKMEFKTVESETPRFRSVDLDEDGILEILRTADTIEVYSLKKNH